MILDDKTHPCCKANIVDHGKYVGRAEIATRHECLKCRKLSTTWSTTDERGKIKCYRMRRNSPQLRLTVQGSSSSPEFVLVIFMLKKDLYSHYTKFFICTSLFTWIIFFYLDHGQYFRHLLFTGARVEKPER